MKHPFAVRKLSAGWSGAPSFIVVHNPGGHRVTTHALPTRDVAQVEADELNIGAMVRPFDEDPRPYEVRRAEAKAAYEAEKK